MIGFQGRAAGRLATETRESHGEHLAAITAVVLEVFPIHFVRSPIPPRTSFFLPSHDNAKTDKSPP